MASIGMGLNYIISSWRNFKCPEDCWGQNKTCVRVLAPSRFVGKFINNSSFASELNPCAQLTRIMCLRFIDWPLSAAVCDCLRGCEWELKRVGPGGEGGWRFEGELPNTTIDGNCVVLKMLMQIIGEIKNGSTPVQSASENCGQDFVGIPFMQFARVSQVDSLLHFLCSALFVVKFAQQPVPIATAKSLA